MTEQKERRYPVEPRAPKILAVDVGGSHVKAVLNGIDERRRFTSGTSLSAQEMVDGVLEMTSDWEYVGVSVGVPAPVVTVGSSATRSTSARDGRGSTSSTRSASPRS